MKFFSNFFGSIRFKENMNFEKISHLRGISADNRNKVQCSFQKKSRVSSFFPYKETSLRFKLFSGKLHVKTFSYYMRW